MGTAMSRRALAWAALGGALLLVSAWAIRKTEVPAENFTMVVGGYRVPVTVIEPPRTGRARATIVFHGLAANRRVMRLLGENLAADDGVRVYLVDLPGHGDNTEPFSFARAEECAAALVEKLWREGMISPAQTAVVGHSMGGAIAIRLADRLAVAATVALSPAPMILPHRMPANLLIISAQYDIPPLRHQAEILSAAGGRDRTTRVDFAQLHAFHLELARGANHHSLLLDPDVAAQTASWMEDSFGSAEAEASRSAGWTDQVNWGSFAAPHRGRPKVGLAEALIARTAPVTGLAGLLLMFPVAVAMAAKHSPERANGSPLPLRRPVATTTESVAGPNLSLTLLEGEVFTLAGVLLLTLVVPLRFLHMYSADYLASLLLVVGVLLLGFNHAAAQRTWTWSTRAILGGAVVGFAVILAAGAWMSWRLADFWLNGARWTRFVELLPFCFVFSFAEEVVLGPVRRGRQGAPRWLLFLLLRFEVWFAAALAFYALASGQALIGVLAPALAAFSVLQRLGTDQIRVRTGSAVGAAVFGAILAAWFLAAVYPLT
jgi:pimeloyl-ACP methyl ester carboxylesterase